jgi:hypothetical protein
MVVKKNEKEKDEVSHLRKELAAMQLEVATLAAKLDALATKLSLVMLQCLIFA